VIDGTNITFEADYLRTGSGVVHDGVNASVVRSSITSVVLDYDHSMIGDIDDGIGAIDAVRASYQGFIGASMACTLLTGPAYTGNCTITLGAATVPRGIDVPFSVTIKDRSGNLLGDHTLVASVGGGGSVSNDTQMTDMYGEAYGFLLTTPTDTSIATIILRVYDNDPRGGIALSKQVTLAR
ncbi:MAG: hypothetical protein NTV06_08695, partial [candidate division Zixibacteria bacterium]|nr:hypothetical protein [candidate division Zixibacteria bacterium]